MADDEVEPLVSSAVAARSLGISARTLQWWVQQGTVKPTRVLPSGHARWRVSDLDAQVRALSEQRD